MSGSCRAGRRADDELVDGHGHDPLDDAGTNKGVGGTLAPNGTIYGLPQAYTGVLALDTKSVGAWPPDVYLSPYFNKL